MSQSGEEFATEIQRVAAARTKSRSLQPLRRLIPFLWPYRWRIAVALIALAFSLGGDAGASSSPSQRVADHGFGAKLRYPD